MQNTCFTIRRDPEVESLLTECLADLHNRIAALPESLRRHLAAVLLGGGYGNGEGGVAIRPEGHFPYNDLDFFVFTRGASRRERGAVNAALRTVGSVWHHRLGVEIDFADARDVRSLPRVADTMMYQALKAGYRVVYGTPDAMAFLPALPAEELPVREGLRLMLNRGTGLLLAQEKIRTGKTDAESMDFIWRNWYKAVFGIGDALLTARHAYSFRLSERTERLNHAVSALLPPESATRLEGWYSEAIAFKAQPYIKNPTQIFKLLPPLVELWRDALFAILAGATGDPVVTLAEARRALLRRDIFGGGQSWKNTLLNLRYCPYLVVKTRLDTAPQLWLLSDLAEILLENHDWKGYSITRAEEKRIARYLLLWRRFN